MVSLLGCAWDLLSDMAGEIVYADLKHLGDVSSAEKHRGKSYFGGKCLFQVLGRLSDLFTFGFACFFTSMLRFPRPWRTFLWVKCLLRWDPGLKRGGKRERKGWERVTDIWKQFYFQDSSPGGQNGCQEAQHEPTHLDGKESC